jgi:RimJ/RimL family protein N-acetyltransferase
MIETDRLILRKWEKNDLEPFSSLNSCKHVSEFLPKPLNKEESDALAKEIMARFEKHGFGLFAVEKKDTAEFIGFNGLNIPGFNAPFMPAIEIGWRLSYENWGKGLATEAARAIINYAFTQLNLYEIVSFTVPANRRSRSVMEKIGMTYNQQDDFNHPNLSDDDPLKRHVLYRLSKRIETSASVYTKKGSNP